VTTLLVDRAKDGRVWVYGEDFIMLLEGNSWYIGAPSGEDQERNFERVTDPEEIRIYVEEARRALKEIMDDFVMFPEEQVFEDRDTGRVEIARAEGLPTPLLRSPDGTWKRGLVTADDGKDNFTLVTSAKRIAAIIHEAKEYLESSGSRYSGESANS
jgi:hypothetical protein